MKAIRPLDYLRMIKDAIHGPKRVYSPEEIAIANWIRGEDDKVRTIIELFLCRIERRALSSQPRTDLELAELWGRDREVRELIAWLVDLSMAPMRLNEDDEEQS